MILKEKIQQDLTQALKEKKELEILTLRQLLAAFLNKEKEKQYKLSKSQTDAKDFSLTEEEMIEAVANEAKKRREAIEGFEKGGRQESAEKEKKELQILQRYLPEQLSEEEIRNLVKEAIEKVLGKEIHPVKSAEGGAEQFNRVKDMGKVMAELSPKIKGKADGSLVSRMVKEALS